MEDLKIQVPPLEEQKRIAAILDKADAIRRKREQAIQLADEFLRSLFLDMFGGPVRNPKGWDKLPLSQLSLSMHTGPFGSQLLHSEFTGSGVAVLGIDNAVQNKFAWGKSRFISEMKFRQLDRYRVHPGDVLITIMGTCGRAAIVPASIGCAINTKHLCCIRLNQSRIVPTYLHACFLYDPIVRRQLGISQRGAVMDGLNMQVIKNLLVSVPPIHLQKTFDKVSKQFGRTRDLNLASFSNLFEKMHQSLNLRAFRGEL